MTEQPPMFFVPGVPAEKQEEVYASLAEGCTRAVPPVKERVYSITFRHDSDDWTATVGMSLTGERYETKRSKGKRVERRRHFSDVAVVLAIFPDDPFMVITDGGTKAGVRSGWANPFMAGRPESIRLFSS